MRTWTHASVGPILVGPARACFTALAEVDFQSAIAQSSAMVCVQERRPRARPSHREVPNQPIDSSLPIKASFENSVKHLSFLFLTSPLTAPC